MILSHLLVHDKGDHRVQQGTRIAIAQALQTNSGSPAKTAGIVRAANSKPTGSASSRRATNAIVCAEAWSNHWRVVDHTEQRLLRAQSREQAQRPQPHQEPIGRTAPMEAEDRVQGVSLRFRQPVQPVEYRAAELVQRRERQLHLRFHARGRAGSEHLRPSPRRGPPTPSFRPWIAAQDQRTAFAAPRRVDESGQGLDLPRPTEQTCRLIRHSHARGKVVPAVRSCACARARGCGTRVASPIKRSRATHPPRPRAGGPRGMARARA